MSLTGITWIDVFVIPAIVVTALVILAKPVRAAWRFVRLLSHFLDDWNGRPERNQPGVPEVLADHGKRLQGIEYELRPNSGKSLRDRVDLIERHVRPADEAA